MLEAATVLRTAQAAAARSLTGLRAEAADSEVAISEAGVAVASAQGAQAELLVERPARDQNSTWTRPAT